MFACYLHNSSGMCLHLARTNHLSAESPSKSPLTPPKKPKKTLKKTKKSPPRGPGGRGGRGQIFFYPNFYYFFRSPCKIWEPYDNPFWKNSDGGRKKERRETSADADGGPRSRVRTAGHSAQPPIDVSKKISAHVLSQTVW
jgi:hypothetical protein